MMSFRRLSLRLKKGILHRRVEPPCSGLALFHSGHYLGADERSKNVGNPNIAPYTDGKVSIPRWKLQWLYVMKRKAEIEGELEERPRSDQLNWNFESELEAFAHRLKIQVHSDTIKAAFTEPANDSQLNEQSEPRNEINNDKLVKAGLEFTIGFLILYLGKTFPLMGQDCGASVIVYLTSEPQLSYIAQNLGYRDLIQSSEFPITPTALHRCFLASIGAVLCGPGGKIEAAKFVHDFVIANLVDKDIVHDVWKPRDPMQFLVNELKSRNLPPPEVRLTKQSGINTITPVFFVGLFCDQKLLSESGGESIIKAETDAAKLALKKIYHVSVDRYHPLVDFFSDPAFMQEVEAIKFHAPGTVSEKQQTSVGPGESERREIGITS